MGKINLVTFVLSCFLDCCFRQSTLHLEMNDIFPHMQQLGRKTHKLFCW